MGNRLVSFFARATGANVLGARSRDTALDTLSTLHCESTWVALSREGHRGSGSVKRGASACPSKTDISTREVVCDGKSTHIIYVESQIRVDNELDLVGGGA